MLLSFGTDSVVTFVYLALPFYLLLSLGVSFDITATFLFRSGLVSALLLHILLSLVTVCYSRSETVKGSVVEMFKEVEADGAGQGGVGN